MSGSSRSGDGVHLLPPGPERAAGRRGCGRAAPGGRRASARWPGRAASAPGSRTASGRRRATPAVTAVNRPVVDLDQHVGVGSARSAQPGVLGDQYVGSPARQLRQHGGQRAHAGGAVVVGRRARPGSARRRSGCARTASRSARARRARPASWPAPVGSTGASPSSAASRSRSAGVEGDLGGDRLGGRSSTVGAVAAGALGRPLCATASTSASSVAASAARASSQAVTRDGIALVALGSHARPGRRWRARRRSRASLLAASTVNGEGQHRVAPVGHPGGAGVVGLAGEVEPPPAVRPDRAGHRRPARPGRPSAAALLDVQLDERADPAQQRPGRGPSRPGRRRRRQRLGERHPVAVAQRAARGPASSAPVSSREPEAGTPNRAPSSSAKAATASGRAGVTPRGAQLVDGEEAR